MAGATSSTPPVPDLERLVELRLQQYREVPDLLEWLLPIGAAWLQLIAQDRPQTAEEVASVLGWPVEEVTVRFGDVLEFVGYDRDTAGEVAAAETSPQGVPLPVFRIRWLETGKTTRMPGCAGDALSSLLSTGQRARIELPCPATGQLVSVQVGPAAELDSVDPATAVAIIESPDSGWHPRDWVRSDCASGLFFASAGAASGWLAEHPGYIAVPMEFFIRAEAQLFTRALAEAHDFYGAHDDR